MISIIIPIYFFDKSVEKCLLSVINQYTKYISITCVINGVSFSEYNEIVILINKLNSEKQLEIIYVYEEKPNANYSRKLGVLNSISEYVLFLDCDDYLANNYVGEFFVEILNKYKPDYLASNIQREVEIDQKLIRSDSMYNFNKPMLLLHKSKDKFDIIENFSSNIVGNVIKRKLLLEFDFMDLPYFQDWNISTKLFKNANTFIFINQICYIYYNRIGSISQFNRMNKNNLLESFNCISDIKNYYLSDSDQSTNRYFLYKKIILFSLAFQKRAKILNEPDLTNLCLNNLINSLPFLFSPKLYFFKLNIFHFLFKARLINFFIRLK